MKALEDNPQQPTPRDWEGEEQAFRHGWALAFLIAVAAAVQFYHLNRPTISLNEAQTYARVSGSFDDLVQSMRQRSPANGVLRDELYWLLARFLPLSEWVIRAIPAIAAAAMVPAMYWLARQIVHARAALVTAALSACSASLVICSRTAAADVPAFLMFVINVASLLAWLRTRRAVPYLAWLASGVAMVALHTSGLVLLAIQPLFILTYLPARGETSRVRRIGSAMTMGLLFLIGIAVIVSGISFTLLKKNTTATTQPTTAPHQLVELAPQPSPRSLANSFILGWQLPNPDERGRIDSRPYYYFSLAVKLLLISLALALLPWRKRDSTPARPFRPWSMAELPRVRFSHQRPRIDEPHPVWRRSLWLAAWLALPTYAIYCIATPDAATPDDWLRQAIRQLGAAWPITLAAFIALAAYAVWWIRKNHPIKPDDIRKHVLPVVQLLIVLLAVFLLCAAIHPLAFQFSYPHLDLRRWLAIAWPPLIITLAWLLMRIPFKWLRRAAIAIVVAANLTLAYHVVTRDTQPRIDLLARDVIDANLSRASSRTYVYLKPHDPLAGPGHIYGPIGKYYLSRLSGRQLTHAQLNSGMEDQPFKIWTTPTELLAATQTKNSPLLRRLILWDTLEAPLPPGRESISHNSDFKAVSEQTFPAYDPWTWSRGTTLRRREYERVGGPPPPPAPSTRRH